VTGVAETLLLVVKQVAVALELAVGVAGWAVSGKMGACWPVATLAVVVITMSWLWVAVLWHSAGLAVVAGVAALGLVVEVLAVAVRAVQLEPAVALVAWVASHFQPLQ